MSGPLTFYDSPDTRRGAIDILETGPQRIVVRIDDRRITVILPEPMYWYLRANGCLYVYDTTGCPAYYVLITSADFRVPDPAAYIAARVQAEALARALQGGAL